MMWLWSLSALHLSLAITDHTMDRPYKVTPAVGHSIAGVFQVSHVNVHNQPQYAYNASEARDVCQTLGTTIASKAHVLEALKQGLETCRFGWIDEHFAVIPRIKPSEICGQNKIGLVPWRAAVTRMFDVFCFNESDVAQSKDAAATDSPPPPTARNGLPSQATTSTSSPQKTVNTRLDTRPYPPGRSVHGPLSSSSSPTLFLDIFDDILDRGTDGPQALSSSQESIGASGKALVITSICVLLLAAVAIFGYLKMSQSCSLSWDVKQPDEYIETEEWTCVRKVMKDDPQIHAQEEEDEEDEEEEEEEEGEEEEREEEKEEEVHIDVEEQ